MSAVDLGYGRFSLEADLLAAARAVAEVETPQLVLKRAVARAEGGFVAESPQRAALRVACAALDAANGPPPAPPAHGASGASGAAAVLPGAPPLSFSAQAHSLAAPAPSPSRASGAKWTREAWASSAGLDGACYLEALENAGVDCAEDLSFVSESMLALLPPAKRARLLNMCSTHVL